MTATEYRIAQLAEVRHRIDDLSERVARLRAMRLRQLSAARSGLTGPRGPLTSHSVGARNQSRVGKDYQVT